MDDLSHFVEIESPSTSQSHLFHAFHFLIEKFDSLEYYTNWIPGINSGGYLYARPKNIPDRGKYQLLIGHTDTVWPLGSIEKMPLVIKDDTISGPGVYDMKTGLLQIIYALKAIDALQIPLATTPLILINSDEEVGSKESTNVIKKLSKISSRAFILEPSLGYEGKLKTRRSGVGKYIIKIRGESAHAGLDPGKGASAIVELSHVIQKLFSLNNPEKGISVNVGMIDGGTRANVIASESTAIVDVRVPTDEDANWIHKKIHALKPENKNTQISVEGVIGRPPMEGTTANRKLWRLAKRKAKLLNIDLEEASAGGGSDGNTSSQFTATLDGLGAVGAGAHALHEFVFQSKIIERSALLSLLLLAPCHTTN
jgi:glutamate carboxypeptidase